MKQHSQSQFTASGAAVDLVPRTPDPGATAGWHIVDTPSDQTITVDRGLPREFVTDAVAIERPDERVAAPVPTSASGESR